MNITNKKISINGIITTIAILSWFLGKVFFQTPNSGSLVLITIIIGIAVYKNISKSVNDWCLLIVLFIFLGLWVFNTDSLDTGYINTAVTIVIICFFFLQISRNYKFNHEITKKNIIFGLDVVDIIFLILFISYFSQAILYGITKNPSAYKFYGHYHYVDYAIQAMFIFMLGIKRGFSLLPWILAVVTILFVPARTFILFILLYFSFELLRNSKKRYIRKLMSMRCLKIIFFLNLLLTFVGVFFVYILPISYQVYEGHGSMVQLFDTSNLTRFQANLYGMISLIKEFPISIFSGIAESDTYFNIINLGYSVDLAPHNSYLQLAVFYSIGFAVVYFIIISKIFDRYMKGINCSFIFSYLIVANILHDMFTSYIFIFLVILNMNEHNKIKSKRLRIRVLHNR